MTSVLHVNATVSSGGAARAVLRIHRALNNYPGHLGIRSKFRAIKGESSDSSIVSGFPRRDPVRRRLQFYLDRWASRGFFTKNPTIHSISTPAPGLGQEINQRNRNGEADIVHLHWLDSETISIEEIGRLSMPVVWTMHDQWAFSGGEHWPGIPDTGSMNRNLPRYVEGYTKRNQPSWESGQDINRLIWNRKRRSWIRPFHLVSPSNWLADCARSSALMANWPIHVVPNPIDLDVWYPADKIHARSLLGLPLDGPLVLFGAVGGTADYRKGADLLIKALDLIVSQIDTDYLRTLRLMIFGQSKPEHTNDFAFPVHYSGKLYDDLSLRLLYSAADLFVVPSRQDNFPNTAVESHACGTPVVAFRTGGLPDIIDHHCTGALADPFDPASLSAEIKWVLEDPQRLRQLGVAARCRAETLWNEGRVAQLYSEVYQDAME
jgi:glycosyltransferase involved in cell wall biosynthesis